MPTFENEETILDPRSIRAKTGLNQQQFWTQIGVTQSGGSRYESGRNMPKPVRELLRIVHVEKIKLESLKGEDLRVVEFLKSQQPDFFKGLKQQVRTLSKGARTKSKSH